MVIEESGEKIGPLVLMLVVFVRHANLTKFVLENILVYWMSMAKIPTSILTKIIQRCFNFYGRGLTIIIKFLWWDGRNLSDPKFWVVGV